MATDSVTVSPTYNGDTVSLTAGMIVRLKPGVNNNVVRAQANSAPGVQGVNGVVVSGASAPTTGCLVVCTGRETVQMEGGLTPNVGDTVYVSPNVAGKGTNVLPAEVSAIGTIADTTNYTSGGTVEVDVVISAVTPASVAGVSSVNTNDFEMRVSPTVGAVFVSQRVAASAWTTAGFRVFAVSPNGNDANAGFADSADQTAADITAATVAAGLVAKRTLAGLAQIIPAVGLGRSAMVVIDSGANGGSGTYADSLGVFSQCRGYANFVIRGTGTNATAGATSFQGDAADLTYLGAKTAAGSSALGYSPVANGTGATIQFTIAGGGAPAWGAEPAKPVYCRLRGDVGNNASTAGKTFVIVQTNASDTLTISSSVTVVTTDKFYVEEPGVVGTGPATFVNNDGVDLSTASQGTLTFQIYGVQSSSTLGFAGGAYTCGFVHAATVRLLNCQSWTANLLFGAAQNNAIFPSFPNVGAIRSNGNFTVVGGDTTIASQSLGMQGSLSVTSPVFFSANSANQIFVGLNITLTGGPQAPYTLNPQMGGSTTALAWRVLGLMTLAGWTGSFNAMAFPNTTSANAVAYQGTCHVIWIGQCSGGLKTNVGWDISNAPGSTISFVSTTGDAAHCPTVTGANGDIFGGTLATTASAPIYATYAGFSAIASTCHLPNGITINATITNGLMGLATTAICVGARNNGGTAIAAGSVVAFTETDGLGVTIPQADTQAHALGGLGLAVSGIAVGNIAGYVVVAGAPYVTVVDAGVPVQLGGQMLYLSPTTAGSATNTSPGAGGTVQKRRLGWMIAERAVMWTPDNVPVAADGNL